MKEQTASHSAAHRAISGAGIQFILQFAGQLLSLFVTRELLSTFSIAENGVFAVIQKSGNLVFTLLVEAGMINFAMRYVVEAPEETNAIISTLFKLRFLLWCVVSAVMFITSWSISAEHAMPLFVWSISLLLVGKWGLLRTPLEILYRIKARFVFISVLALLDTFLLMVLLLADIMPLSVHSVMLWYLLSSIPGFAILFIKVRGWEILAVPFSKKWVKRFTVDSLPYVGSVILLHINTYSETLFLSLFGTMEHVGIFEALGRIIIPMFMIIGSLVNGIYPFVVQFHNEDMERCKQYVFYGFKVSAVVSLLIAMGTLSTIPWIISFFTGGKYASAVDGFMLYSWLVIPNFSFNYVLSICLAIGLQKRTTYMAAVLMVSELLIAPFLISHYMVNGAVIAKLISNILGWYISIRVLAEFFQDNRISGFLWRFVPVSIAVLSAGTAGLIFGLSVPLLIAIVATIFVILTVMSKTVDANDYRLVQSFARSVLGKLGFQRK